MNTAAKLSAYGAALALLLAGGWAAGAAVGPLSPMAASSGHGGIPGAQGAGHGDGDGHSGTVAQAASERPAGLASSRGGYTLTLADVSLTAGTPQRLSFTVTGPNGAPVTAFDVEHDKRMHLIVVRRDTTGFQHMHPEMAVSTVGAPAVPAAGPATGPADPATHPNNGHGH